MYDIYLDHAATTPVHPDALGLMLPFFGNHFHLPGDPSNFSEKPGEAVQEARSRTARLIGAAPQEIVFTSGGTEAANLAVLGAARARGRGHIITSSIEHDSVLDACRGLESEGFSATFLPAGPSGRVSPDSVEESLRDDTILISIMHVNHETGVVQPVGEIGALARKRGILFHCDAAQSAGKIALDVKDLNVDLLSFSSHKLYGPKGAGALFVRSGVRLQPVMFGPGREMGLRPGTLDVPCIVGFGKSCEIAGKDLEKNARRMQECRDWLERNLLDRISGAMVNGASSPRAPHILSISIPGVQADSLAAWLSLEGITASAGASFFSRQPSRVLTAMGLPPETAFGTVRFSTGWENTRDEMQDTAEVTALAAAGLRDFSEKTGSDETCIVTFSGKKEAGHAVLVLRKEGIPCAVTARPVELEHISGTRIALAVPCAQQEKAGALLGGAGIGPTGMHPLKGLRCRQQGEGEKRFWNLVERIRGRKE
jgi:cysteine desulfurase